MAGTAFTPANWTGYDEQSLTNPGDALDDFTLLIDIADLSATWASNVQSDGGDIRVTKGDDTELAFDLLNWAYNAGSPTGILAVGYSGTMAASGTQNVRVYAGYTGGTAAIYSVDETYGGESAYPSHCVAFYPDGGGNDRTANDNHLTMTGSPSVGGAAGPWGSVKGTDYDGSTQYGTATAPVTAAPLSFVASIEPDSITAQSCVSSLAKTSGSQSYFQLGCWGAVTNDPLVMISRDTAQGISSYESFTADAWQRVIGVTASAGSRFAYRNGAASAENTTSITPASVNRFGVGVLARADLDDRFNGALSLVALHNTGLPAAWVTQDNAQQNQATFWGTWAWTAIGGGGAVPRLLNLRRRVAA